MNAKQAAKTLIVGLATVLGFTTAALAWGVSRGVVTTVPADSVEVIIGITIAVLATIPVTVFAFRETSQ